jgi:endonuclease G
MEQCAAHLPYGQPKSPKQDTTAVCRIGYALEHDNRAKIPAWVSYTLTPEHAIGCFPRISRFQPEPSLRSDATAVMKDYAKSGYDIGHMANDSDMRWSVQAEQESNIFANAAPQLPGLNRASWKSLEVRTRSWAVGRQHPLLVYVGPIYSMTEEQIGRGVVVPSAFYKVIVDETTLEVMAFIYQHLESSDTPEMHLSSLAEVQRQTGIVLPMPAGAKLGGPIWPVTGSSIKAKAGVCAIN